MRKRGNFTALPAWALIDVAAKAGTSDQIHLRIALAKREGRSENHAGRLLGDGRHGVRPGEALRGLVSSDLRRLA